MFGLLCHQPLQYNEYHYPAWAELVGWGLAMSSIIMIPLVAILQLCKTPGTLKEVCLLPVWRPSLPTETGAGQEVDTSHHGSLGTDAQGLMITDHRVT